MHGMYMLKKEEEIKNKKTLKQRISNYFRRKK
jgi:hypothetical protein